MPVALSLNSQTRLKGNLEYYFGFDGGGNDHLCGGTLVIPSYDTPFRISVEDIEFIEERQFDISEYWALYERSAR